MIKVESIDVWGFEHAIRGMRNPMNSWDKSDSDFIITGIHGSPEIQARIGKNDTELMQKLYQAGSSHRKYLRQIFVSMDVTAPLYWWKEADTYKVGTVANSCSTMHFIHKEKFDMNDFSHDGLESLTGDEYNLAQQDWINRIDTLNYFRDRYLKTKDKRYWRQLIEKLPSSYNQMRTLTMNYENAINIVRQRTGHKLDEWRKFVAVLCGLPYLDEITGGSI